MAQWSKRNQHYPDGSIEQRVEQITLVCLEMLKDELNDELSAVGKATVSMADLTPPLGAAVVPQRGLYPVVQQQVARAISMADTLQLPPADKAQLLRMSTILDKRVDVDRELCDVLEQFPQLHAISASPEALGKKVMSVVKTSLEEYILNRPVKPTHNSQTEKKTIEQLLDETTTQCLDAVMEAINDKLSATGQAPILLVNVAGGDQQTHQQRYQGLYPVVKQLVAMEFSTAKSVAGYPVGMREAARMAGISHEVTPQMRLDALEGFKSRHPQLENVPELSDLSRLFELIVSHTVETTGQAIGASAAPKGHAR